MKSKLFEGDFEDIEKDLDEWLYINNNIKILNMTQSQVDSRYTLLTIIYSKGESNPVAEWEKKLDDIILMNQHPYEKNLKSSQIIEQIIYRPLFLIKKKLNNYSITHKNNNDGGVTLTLGTRNASNYRFKITFNPTENFDVITATIQFPNNKDLITEHVPINEITQDYVGNFFLKAFEYLALKNIDIY